MTHLEAYSDALGKLFAHLGLCLIIVLMVAFCIGSMAGAYRKGLERRKHL